MANLDPNSARFVALPPFQQLVEIMQALRAPGGCPWDREQTHQTLTRYLLEETYETLEAIESQDFPDMCSELGDLLLQIVFHAQLAREAGHFQIDDVCRSIVDKMVRRHPHVFGSGKSLATPEEVLGQWEQIKKGEKGKAEPESILTGLPRTLPALQLAERLQGRASQVGFDYENTPQAWAKFEEEINELREDPSEEELGDVLFACVSVARKLKIDPETALRAACHKFSTRFAAVERKLGDDLQYSSTATLLQAWQEAKDDRPAT